MMGCFKINDSGFNLRCTGSSHSQLWGHCKLVAVVFNWLHTYLSNVNKRNSVQYFCGVQKKCNCLVCQDLCILIFFQNQTLLLISCAVFDYKLFSVYSDTDLHSLDRIVPVFCWCIKKKKKQILCCDGVAFPCEDMSVLQVYLLLCCPFYLRS